MTALEISMIIIGLVVIVLSFIFSEQLQEKKVELTENPIDVRNISREAIKEQIEEELQFIPEGGMPDMQVLTWDGQLLALELPQTVDLEIIETAPGIKGASASSRTKPATMSTGLVIQVPEYLTTGEKIRIHIEECRYMGRAD